MEAKTLLPKFDSNGLVVAIAQDAYSGAVLMQAYMNEEAYNLTLSTGYAHYYSRSRKKLWKKGEESGHLQKVASVSLDCDCDGVLLRVIQTGAACHTGNKTCFFNHVKTNEDIYGPQVVLNDFETIKSRMIEPVEGSYTNYLFSKGIDKICKKISEESGEVIIAAKNNSKEELAAELADLTFHSQVLLCKMDMTCEDVFSVMQKRAEAQRARDYDAVKPETKPKI